MNDLTHMLGNLSPTVSSVLQQVSAGNHASVSDADAHQAYGQVAAQLSPQEFQQVASDAYTRLTPDQRTQVADYLRSQAANQSINVPQLPSGPQAASDPAALAAATSQIHGQNPNLLQQLFAPGGTFSSPIAKMALLGITAMAAKRLTGR